MKIDFPLPLMVYHKELVHLPKNKMRWRIGHLSKTQFDLAKKCIKNIISTSVLIVEAKPVKS